MNTTLELSSITGAYSAAGGFLDVEYDWSPKPRTARQFIRAEGTLSSLTSSAKSACKPAQEQSLTGGKKRLPSRQEGTRQLSPLSLSAARESAETLVAADPKTSSPFLFADKKLRRGECGSHSQAAPPKRGCLAGLAPHPSCPVAPVIGKSESAAEVVAQCGGGPRADQTVIMEKGEHHTESESQRRKKARALLLSDLQEGELAVCREELERAETRRGQLEQILAKTAQALESKDARIAGLVKDLEDESQAFFVATKRFAETEQRLEAALQAAKQNNHSSNDLDDGPPPLPNTENASWSRVQLAARTAHQNNAEDDEKLELPAPITRTGAAAARPPLTRATQSSGSFLANMPVRSSVRRCSLESLRSTEGLRRSTIFPCDERQRPASTSHDHEQGSRRSVSRNTLGSNAALVGRPISHGSKNRRHAADEMPALRCKRDGGAGGSVSSRHSSRQGTDASPVRQSETQLQPLALLHSSISVSNGKASSPALSSLCPCHPTAGVATSVSRNEFSTANFAGRKKGVNKMGSCKESCCGASISCRGGLGHDVRRNRLATGGTNVGEGSRSFSCSRAKGSIGDCSAVKHHETIQHHERTSSVNRDHDLSTSPTSLDALRLEAAPPAKREQICTHDVNDQDAECMASRNEFDLHPSSPGVSSSISSIPLNDQLEDTRSFRAEHDLLWSLSTARGDRLETRADDCRSTSSFMPPSRLARPKVGAALAETTLPPLRLQTAASGPHGNDACGGTRLEGEIVPPLLENDDAGSLDSVRFRTQNDECLATTRSRRTASAQQLHSRTSAELLEQRQQVYVTSAPALPHLQMESTAVHLLREAHPSASASIRKNYQNIAPSVVGTGEVGHPVSHQQAGGLAPVGALRGCKSSGKKKYCDQYLYGTSGGLEVRPASNYHCNSSHSSFFQLTPDLSPRCSPKPVTRSPKPSLGGQNKHALPHINRLPLYHREHLPHVPAEEDLPEGAHLHGSLSSSNLVVLGGCSSTYSRSDDLYTIDLLRKRNLVQQPPSCSPYTASASEKVQQVRTDSSLCSGPCSTTAGPPQLCRTSTSPAGNSPAIRRAAPTGAADHVDPLRCAVEHFPKGFFLQRGRSRSQGRQSRSASTASSVPRPQGTPVLVPETATSSAPTAASNVQLTPNNYPLVPKGRASSGSSSLLVSGKPPPADQLLPQHTNRSGHRSMPLQQNRSCSWRKRVRTMARVNGVRVRELRELNDTLDDVLSHTTTSDHDPHLRYDTSCTPNLMETSSSTLGVLPPTPVLEHTTVPPRAHEEPDYSHRPTCAAASGGERHGGGGSPPASAPLLPRSGELHHITMKSGGAAAAPTRGREDSTGTRTPENSFPASTTVQLPLMSCGGASQQGSRASEGDPRPEAAVGHHEKRHCGSATNNCCAKDKSCSPVAAPRSGQSRAPLGPGGASCDGLSVSASHVLPGPCLPSTSEVVEVPKAAPEVVDLGERTPVPGKRGNDSPGKALNGLGLNGGSCFNESGAEQEVLDAQLGCDVPMYSIESPRSAPKVVVTNSCDRNFKILQKALVCNPR
ncbi:unnamed protein product [Amoebophrya sp. A120]|nr:unnamed protein product [Amoebophrya sp. A120]|eukprot:GSA120T00021640001.1